MAEKDDLKMLYGQQFGLPAEQIRWFEELTAEQVEEVAWEFSVHEAYKYVYGVKRDGKLVRRREPRDPRMEMQGRF